MELAQFFKPGMTYEQTFTVEEKYLASHVGSGSLRVFSTPSMILTMEMTAHHLLAQQLPEDYSSVGTHVDVRHLTATPFGDTVRVQAEVLAVEGRQVTFAVRAWDSQEQIGEGRHVRFVIEVERFLKRVAAKSQKA